MYYRPEEWDALDPIAIEWCNEHGLGGVLRYANERACDAWKLFYMCGYHKLSVDELEEKPDYTMIHLVLKEAYGAYNALLIAAHDAKRDDVWQMIYGWGHYGVFY